MGNLAIIFGPIEAKNVGIAIATARLFNEEWSKKKPK
jgi:hypothetical protein